MCEGPHARPWKPGHARSGSLALCPGEGDVDLCCAGARQANRTVCSVRAEPGGSRGRRRCARCRRGSLRARPRAGEKWQLRGGAPGVQRRLRHQPPVLRPLQHRPGADRPRSSVAGHRAVCQVPVRRKRPNPGGAPPASAGIDGGAELSSGETFDHHRSSERANQRRWARRRCHPAGRAPPGRRGNAYSPGQGGGDPGVDPIVVLREAEHQTLDLELPAPSSKAAAAAAREAVAKAMAAADAAARAAGEAEVASRVATAAAEREKSITATRASSYSAARAATAQAQHEAAEAAARGRATPGGGGR